MKNVTTALFNEEISRRLDKQECKFLIYSFAGLLQLSDYDLNAISVAALKAEAECRVMGFVTEPEPAVIAGRISRMELPLEDRKWLLNLFREVLGVEE